MLKVYILKVYDLVINRTSINAYVSDSSKFMLFLTRCSVCISNSECKQKTTRTIFMKTEQKTLQAEAFSLFDNELVFTISVP